MFEGMLTSGAVVLPLCMDAAADPLPCQVESSNDGNGLYAYTFHRDDVPHVWGYPRRAQYVRRTKAVTYHLMSTVSVWLDRPTQGLSWPGVANRMAPFFQKFRMNA
jgi:hypothetical protein